MLELRDALAEMDVDAKQLQLHELVGKGGFGSVYRGTWRGLNVRNSVPSLTLIAVVFVSCVYTQPNCLVFFGYLSIDCAALRSGAQYLRLYSVKMVGSDQQRGVATGGGQDGDVPGASIRGQRTAARHRRGSHHILPNTPQRDRNLLP